MFRSVVNTIRKNHYTATVSKIPLTQTYSITVDLHHQATILIIRTDLYRGERRFVYPLAAASASIGHISSFVFRGDYCTT